MRIDKSGKTVLIAGLIFLLLAEALAQDEITRVRQEETASLSPDNYILRLLEEGRADPAMLPYLVRARLSTLAGYPESLVIILKGLYPADKTAWSDAAREYAIPVKMKLVCLQDYMRKEHLGWEGENMLKAVFPDNAEEDIEKITNILFILSGY